MKNGELHNVVCQHGIMTRDTAGHATHYVQTTCLAQPWTSLGMHEVLSEEMSSHEVLNDRELKQHWMVASMQRTLI